MGSISIIGAGTMARILGARALAGRNTVEVIGRDPAKAAAIAGFLVDDHIRGAGKLVTGNIGAREICSPQIPTGHLITRAGPKSDFAAENVVPLACKPAVTAAIVATLNAISAKLTTAILLQIDNAIITQHADYATVAAGFRPGTMT